MLYFIFCQNLSSSSSMSNSILFLSLFLFLPFVVDSLYFNFTSFRQGDPGDIFYHGDATPDEDGTVNFNNAEQTSQVGWITYSKKVPIWSHKTGKASDFSTSFSFKIDARNLSADGHGICFFLAPMGAQLPAYSVVHVEFDTFNNPGWDPNDVGSHVGINNNSLVSSNYTSWNASSHSQDICHAKISYDSVTKNLSVTWAYELTATSDPKESSSLSYIIDLAKVLPSDVMFGFIAAAGTNTEEHRLLSWELSSSLDSDKADSRIGLVIGISASGFVF
ncbi:L-type lectin-domain containing receptor kinase IX.2 [Arabidopsis thaliana]